VIHKVAHGGIAAVSPCEFLMLRRVFEYSIVSLLSAAALLKIGAALGSEPFLIRANGLLPFMTNRTLTVTAAACEVGVVLFVCLTNRWLIKMRLVFALGWVFLMYRVALWFFGISAPCSCLGSLGSWLHWPNSMLSLLTWLILTYMLAGSSYFLFFSSSMSDSHGSVGSVANGSALP